MRRRRTFRRRSFRRRRPSYGYKRGYRRFSKGVKRVVYRMSELKQVAYNLGTAASPTVLVNNNVNIFVMPQIAQGPGDNQRIGNRVFGRWLQYNFKITTTAVLADVVFDFVIYIIWPRKFSQNDALAAITFSNFPVYELPDQDNWYYKKILKFSQTNQDGSGGSGYLNAKSDRWFRFYIPCNRGFEFPNAVSNSINKQFYMVISNQIVTGTSANATHTIKGHCKLSYKDM